MSADAITDSGQVAAPGDPPPRRRRRRGRKALGAAAAVVAAGAVGAAAVGFGGVKDKPTAAAGDLPPSTAKVSRETMVDTDDIDGQLGFGATTVLTGQLPGILTTMPLAGDTVARGKRIYEVDGHPVVLMYGARPAYRAMSSGVEGPDVKQLETNLQKLGYTGFTVDDEFTAATATAVREWQEDLGLQETGVVELGRVVFAPDAIRLESITAGVGQPATAGQEVLKFTGTTRQVTLRLDVADERLARKGVKVGVNLPDGKTVDGVVSRVYTVIEEADSTDTTGDQTKIEVLVSLSDPKSAAGLSAAVVTVVFTAAERKDVLAVPIAALVALAEGGYGVEVVNGSATSYVRVKTGLFTGGRVEISGPGIAEGAVVGMPK